MKEANTSGRKRLVFDLALVLCLLLFSLLLMLLVKKKTEPGAYVKVTVDGVAVAELPLEENGEFSLNGGSNVLVIKDGAAFVTYGSCPKHYCVKSGAVRLVGERIYCLPNRLVIEVLGEGDVDFVSQ